GETTGDRFCRWLGGKKAVAVAEVLCGLTLVIRSWGGLTDVSHSRVTSSIQASGSHMPTLGMPTEDPFWGSAKVSSGCVKTRMPARWSASGATATLPLGLGS